MAHNPYHFSWNTTPSGNTPPASTQSPEQFLEEFANLDVQELSDEDRIFLPNAGQMQQNIAMSRFGLDNAMAAQRLSGTNNLMNMTAGMGINSMGQGFGSRQNMFNSALQNANMQNQQATVQNIADYRSDVLGEQYRYQDALTTALGNLIRSDESEVTVVPGTTPSINPADANVSGVIGGGFEPGQTVGQFTFPNPQDDPGPITNPNTGRVFNFNPETGLWELQLGTGG